MKTEKKKINLTMLSVILVCGYALAGQTIFLEAANGSYASADFPADGEMIVGDTAGANIWTKLIFVPGATAVKHTGYFSDDYSKVTGRAQDANLGQPPYEHIPGWEYTFFAGNPAVPPADDTLVRETVYYWAVDETDALGNVYSGDVWEFGIQGFKAFAPNPPDGAVGIDTTVLLSWLPGFGVEMHDVYLGTDFDDVNNALYNPMNLPLEYIGTVTEPNILVTSLVFNTTYYWRVDEISGRMPPPIGGGSYYYGDVWSFTVINGKAQAEFPDDGAVIPGDIDIDNIWTRLIFIPGANAVKHTGYFSDDYSKVESRAQDANLGPPPYGHMPGWEFTFMVGNHNVPPADDTLVRGMTYYWTVDETDALGTTYPGDIWEFTIQDYKASSPNPPDGAVGIDTTVLLSWVPGFDVEEHDVYFGTDFDDVNNANFNPYNQSPVFLDTVTEPNILVTGLSENTWYYWRVDEVSYRLPPPIDGGNYYYGDVWSFKTKTAGLMGLIAHWKFDEGSGSVAYDSAGTNDGTIYGATTTTGKLGGALDFDGVDDYVDMADTVQNYLGTNYTFSAWIKTRTILGVHGIAVYRRSTLDIGYQILLQLQHNNSDVQFIVGSLGNNAIASYPDALTINTWYHVAGVREGNILNVYVNGVSGTPDSETFGTISPDNFKIGANDCCGHGIDSLFDGAIDDVRIYDRALSAGEIEELYQSGVPVGKTYHVDGATGDNTNDGLSRGTAFATIQRGINAAEDFDTVLVWPGVYNEEIGFLGEAITVKSAADAAVVEINYGYAFSFFSAEGPDTVLSNFVIRNSQYGIYLINGSSPTLSNLTIVNNDFGISAYNGADPDISNCILWGNNYGDLFREPVPLQAKYSFVQEEIEANPVSHWKFDEGSGAIAYDSAGSNDGTIYGAAWTTGQLGGALDFDGVDDYVDIPYVSSLDIDASQGISLSVWFKLNSYPAGWNQGPIFGLFDSAGSGLGTKNYLFIDKPLYGNLITWDQAPPYYGWIKSIKPDLDTWYHVAVVEDSSYRAIYINGSLDISDNISETYQGNAPDTIRIGSRADFAPYSFDGTIDEVSIYNRALSSGEIEQIYQNLAGPGFVDANNGDYHLLSERGRYWPVHDVWVLDDVTSPCIDGGDPDVSPSNERMPNGRRINMGAYGNTAYASMSEWPLKHDSNFDGVVNMLDLAELALEWLEGDALPSPPPPPPSSLPGQASNPNPAEGATGVSRTTYLSWTPGSNAVSHDLYFGETNPPAFQGNLISAMFGPGSLAYDTTYYWRIDEVNPSGTTTGTVWSFTIATEPPPPPGPPM